MVTHSGLTRCRRDARNTRPATHVPQQLAFFGPKICQRIDDAIRKHGTNGVAGDPQPASVPRGDSPPGADAVSRAEALRQGVRERLQARNSSMYAGAAKATSGVPAPADPQRKTRAKKPYSPREGTGAYALLLTLFEAHQVRIYSRRRKLS